MFIGVDIGGSKTEAVLVDTSAHVVAHVHAGPGNWEGIGLDAAAHLYNDVINQLLQQSGRAPSDITAHGWGIAGLDWPSDDGRLRPILSSLLPHAPFQMVNDAFLPLRAGSRFPYGIGVIAGTGSTVVGIGTDGAQFRTFGLGSMWGDFDGARGIAYAACQHLANAYYNQVPPSLLASYLAEWSGYKTLPALAEAVSRDEFDKNLATFAPFVMQAATAGDAIAVHVIQQAAELLASNATSVARQINLLSVDFDVVLAGGVATGATAMFYDVFTSTVRQHAAYAHIKMLQCRPVVGAVLLAYDLVDNAHVQSFHASLLAKELS